MKYQLTATFNYTGSEDEFVREYPNREALINDFKQALADESATSFVFVVSKEQGE